MSRVYANTNFVSINRKLTTKSSALRYQKTLHLRLLHSARGYSTVHVYLIYWEIFNLNECKEIDEYTSKRLPPFAKL